MYDAMCFVVLRSTMRPRQSGTMALIWSDSCEVWFSWLGLAWFQVHKKPRCPVQGCKEQLKLSNKFECADCGMIVCLKHRFKEDHNCQPKSSRFQISRFLSTARSQSSSNQKSIQANSRASKTWCWLDPSVARMQRMAMKRKRKLLWCGVVCRPAAAAEADALQSQKRNLPGVRCRI